jgi:hypothetical protein
VKLIVIALMILCAVQAIALHHAVQTVSVALAAIQEMGKCRPARGLVAVR